MQEKQILFGIGGLVVGVVAGVFIGGNSADQAVRDAVAEAMAEMETRAAESAEASREAIDAIGARIDAIEARVSESAGEAAGTAEDLRARIAEIGDAVERGFTDTADRVAALATGSDGAPSQETSEPEVAAEPESVDVNAEPPTGLAPGETAILADGAARVFVSRVDAEGARLSVNGTLVTLGTGESTAAGDCTVTLDAVDRGRVTVSGECGGGSGDTAAAASEDAAPAGEAVAGDAPEGMRPGETQRLVDDALWVFVSGATPDGSARIAVNGVETVVLAPGESVEVPSGEQTCTVTVTSVNAGRVAVEGSCQ